MSQFHSSRHNVDIMICSRLKPKINISQVHHLIERLAFIREATNPAVTRPFSQKHLCQAQPHSLKDMWGTHIHSHSLSPHTGGSCPMAPVVSVRVLWRNRTNGINEDMQEGIHLWNWLTWLWRLHHKPAFCKVETQEGQRAVQSPETQRTNGVDSPLSLKIKDHEFQG